MGVFGAPITHGDDPERAVRAALAVRDWATEESLQLRIAVNTGEAIVAFGARPEHGEAMIAGDVINTAARLQTAAPVGSVLVGEETYASTRGAIEYRPAPPVAAKGKSTPVRSWLALRPLAAIGERPTSRVPMVGRERELGVLTEIWVRVTDEQRPHLVTVFGPAGIGKSRLALEFAQIVAGGGGRALRGRSTPYGANSPYSAFGHHVKQTAQVFDSDELADARTKLEESITALVGAEEGVEHARHLGILMGLGGEGDVSDRETLFFSARVFVEALAAHEPTVLLFEDIHWADASLLDLLETLATRVRDVPLLLLALARPEVLTQRPGWGGGLPAYTALPLDRLSEDHALSLAELLLGDSDQGATRAGAVAARDGGQSAVHRRARSVARRALDHRRRRAADERACDRRGPAGRASARGARSPRRRVGRRPRVLAGRARLHRRPRQPLGSARSARGA